MPHPNFKSSLMEITQSSICNQAIFFFWGGGDTDLRLSLKLNYIFFPQRTKEQAVWQILISFCLFMIHSPLVCFFFFFFMAEMINIVALIIKRMGRSLRDQGQWRKRRRGEGRNCQGEMVCRSMKNCTGILPPQRTVWEADLISGESIRLEL